MYMHKYIHCVHVPDFNRPGRKLIYWCKLKTLRSKNYCQKVDALIAKQKLLPKIGKKKVDEKTQGQMTVVQGLICR